MKVLLDYMARVPLLRHELMAHFERFKLNNREFVEAPNPIPKVEEKETTAGTNQKIFIHKLFCSDNGDFRKYHDQTHIV